LRTGKEILRKKETTRRRKKAKRNMKSFESLQEPQRKPRKKLILEPGRAPCHLPTTDHADIISGIIEPYWIFGWCTYACGKKQRFRATELRKEQMESRSRSGQAMESDSQEESSPSGEGGRESEKKHRERARRKPRWHNRPKSVEAARAVCLSS
jgi:hypothetical protein